MRSIERKNKFFGINLLIAAQCFLPLVSSWCFAERYHFLTRSAGYHLLIVFVGYLAPVGVVALLTGVRRCRTWAGWKYVLGLAWGGWTVILYFAYLLAWGGRLSMGMNLTPKIMMPYIMRPSLTYSTFSDFALHLLGCARARSLGNAGVLRADFSGVECRVPTDKGLFTAGVQAPIARAAIALAAIQSVVRFARQHLRGEFVGDSLAPFHGLDPTVWRPDFYLLGRGQRTTHHDGSRLRQRHRAGDVQGASSVREKERHHHLGGCLPGRSPGSHGLQAGYHTVS